MSFLGGKRTGATDLHLNRCGVFPPCRGKDRMAVWIWSKHGRAVNQEGEWLFQEATNSIKNSNKNRMRNFDWNIQRRQRKCLTIRPVIIEYNCKTNDILMQTIDGYNGRDEQRFRLLFAVYAWAIFNNDKLFKIHQFVVLWICQSKWMANVEFSVDFHGRKRRGLCRWNGVSACALLYPFKS